MPSPWRRVCLKWCFLRCCCCSSPWRRLSSLHLASYSFLHMEACSWEERRGFQQPFFSYLSAAGLTDLSRHSSCAQSTHLVLIQSPSVRWDRVCGPLMEELRGMAKKAKRGMWWGPNPWWSCASFALRCGQGFFVCCLERRGAHAGCLRHCARRWSCLRRRRCRPCKCGRVWKFYSLPPVFVCIEVL